MAAMTRVPSQPSTEACMPMQAYASCIIIVPMVGYGAGWAIPVVSSAISAASRVRRRIWSLMVVVL